MSCITTREGGGMFRSDYIRRIDEFAESIITISGRVSDEFQRIEKIRRGEISEHATKADLDTACKAAVASILAAKPPRRKPQKRPGQEKDSTAVRRDDDTGRVITEINRRHRAGLGSYPKIIGVMTKDPVWGARMRHMSAASWRAKAISR